jgi:hypothetical protein
VDLGDARELIEALRPSRDGPDQRFVQPLGSVVLTEPGAPDGKDVSLRPQPEAETGSREVGDLVVGDLRRTKKAAARIELQPFVVENELAVAIFQRNPCDRFRSVRPGLCFG